MIFNQKQASLLAFQDSESTHGAASECCVSSGEAIASECSRLSDLDLVSRAKDLIAKERRLTLLVLEHLREIESRRLYAARGYSSLHSFAVHELGYSDGAAYRRIESMRLLKEVPQAKEAIQTGSVSLTTASTLQTFFKNEKRGRGKTYSKEEKAKLLESMTGKSKRQCEQALFAISPQAIPQERERVVSPTQLEISFVASAELQEKLGKLKALLAHTAAAHSHAALIEKLADLALERLDPLRKAGAKKAALQRAESKKAEVNKAEQVKKAGQLKKDRQVEKDGQLKKDEQERNSPEKPSHSKESQSDQAAGIKAMLTSPEKFESKSSPAPKATLTSPAKSANRHIPTATRRLVWQKDQGCCTYRDPITNRRCQSSYKLQIEHLQPYARGGTHDIHNLTLRCQAHNLLSAQQVYGARKVETHVSKAG